MPLTTTQLDSTADSESDDSSLLTEEQSKDDIFFVLSNYRRRFVLQYLLESSGPISLRTLSEELAAWENEVDPSMTTSVQRKRAYVSLRQTHLPKLDQLGIISYDDTRGIAEMGDGIDDIETYLQPQSDTSTMRKLRYVGMGILMSVFAVVAFAVLFGL